MLSRVSHVWRPVEEYDDHFIILGSSKVGIESYTSFFFRQFLL